ncbi:hypothetical protein IB238_00615 [Rhizobium sp. ARZ01]|uniref:hypothetical protein n=1 Tax=Rhizobium sp. ARZ01 TaxID=2769313 RepID=UPI0017820925|nr:hypothetical protein [Rhizobium sp. ARZ01]MBD9371140.1 hypothetical protein [Rhizobium sp. ARZ01]
MGIVDDLRIHFDFLSRTVLLQSHERSHVLRGGFSSKEAAEYAAVRYAAEHWQNRSDKPELKQEQSH